MGEGRLSVLQMRCLHNHRPCPRPVLLAPRDATGNGPNARVKHLRMLELLLISVQGIELLRTYPTACALRGLCRKSPVGLLLGYFPLSTDINFIPE